ncbi:MULTISPECIES: phosphatidylglycerophosphatase B [Tenebrionibacter/Tenebrionicola group]|jgi:phosphatidylglycerophosphatase B|uniref:undecaprenyl-diphosphate phosphatase n=2 Tax=Tenebrionibacter/Tenebrionicola group TaxID=2969848 RepID=A0A8K0V4Z5_9ENTR|nr:MULTISPECIES: phosphatidylglycerophosphatase B [Tenebrionibacter/Tenebrionicola group]MBK4715836.1 phosphatidylglycerophosphatase B [Tenebrionibacter intestinalis]MBV4411438.1 phosphatidylglycerophosphatase B [Tenebrionicola larvae]MBV5096608.1 phosphatidylglycerophosphatase B [Tenebrionicola larvae]
MLTIAKRTAFAALLLLIVPVFAMLSGWVWRPDQDALWLKMMYWITETVTQPWGIITHVALVGWFLWCLRFRLKAALALFTLLAIAILAGQGAKSVIKEQVRAPRPYVAWLEKTHNVPVEQFYNLKRKVRSQLVARQLQDETRIPSWLRAHWQNDTGFAFPSGHTMFAASWALLAVGLLWPRRRIISISLLMLWACAVMSSRLLLGMHWPRDLIAATLISWLLVTLACWLAQRFCGPLAPPCKEQTEIDKRAR